MKKQLVKIISSVIAFACVVTTAICFSNAKEISENTASYQYRYYIDEANHFDYVYQDHTFTCYKIYLTGAEVNEENVQGVAVKWFGFTPSNPQTAIGTAINVPTVATLDDVDYDVLAIAKGGFARSTFTTISIPNTVREIREEAFAYCMNMTSFTFPYDINQIAPNTFMDCRKLATVYYRNSEGNSSLRNTSINKIGDHAFESCVSLSSFICPESVTEFHKSCFQKCTNLKTFDFPSTVKENNVITNEITIEEYAFADCKNLENVYFEENVKTIGDFAFVDCNSSLVFSYTGSESNLTSTIAKFGLWRRKIGASGIIADIATPKANQDTKKDFYTLNFNCERILQSQSYPGLKYTVKNSAVKLDCANLAGGPTLISSGSSYAIINNFTAPLDWVANFFVHPNDTDEDGVKDDNEQAFSDNTFKLIIPNTLPSDPNNPNSQMVPVKIIENNSFVTYDNQTRIRSVKFNSNLVQIRHQAFLGCNKIEQLDFSQCLSLREISHSVFQEPNLNSSLDIYNTSLHELALPSTLWYIGDFAFYNFAAITKKLAFTTNENAPQLRVIGAYAFAINTEYSKYGITQVKKGTLDIVLPGTLSDSYALDAAYVHPDYSSRANIYAASYASDRGYAVGTHAFDSNMAIKTVTMGEPSGGSTTSFASGSFVRCKNLVKFKSNNKLLLIGPNMFESNFSLREVFLYTQSDDSYPSDVSYPWGVNDANNNYSGPIIPVTSSTAEFVADAVIYVSGSKAPKSCDSYKSTSNYRWNVQGNGTNAPYENELYSSYSGLSSVPTYYNVNFLGISDGNWSGEENNKIVYWKPTANTFITSELTSTDDYDQGIITLMKNTKGSTNEATVVKCYADSETLLYRCSTATSAGQFNPTYWARVDEYDGTKAYSVGDCVLVGLAAYECTTAISSSDNWKQFDETKWLRMKENVEEAVSAYSTTTAYSKDAFAWVTIQDDVLDTIDLTTIPNTSSLGEISSKLTTIGKAAFAEHLDSPGYNVYGYYFVLPTTVTTIQESAFYRRNKSYGVRIVTYKDGSGYHSPDGGTLTISTTLSAAFNSFNTSYKGYCLLPNIVTIGPNAFYNNRFKQLELGSNLSLFGASAFYVHTTTGSTRIMEDVSFVPNTNPYFSMINSSVYYVGEAGRKTLVYHTPAYKPQGGLTVDNGTVVIGLRAVAASNITSVSIPTGLKVIQGGAFEYSRDLVSVTGDLSTISYIGGSSVYDTLKNTWEELSWSLFDENASYSVNDIVKYEGAFYKCTTAIGSGGDGEWVSGHWSAITVKTFNSSTTYSANDYVMDNPYLYKCTGTSNAYQHIEVEDGLDDHTANKEKIMGFSAFYSCRSLETINIKSMTSLKRIGRNALRDCVLTNTCGGDSYTFQVDNNSPTTVTTGVIDLSNKNGKLDEEYDYITFVGQKAFDNNAYNSSTGKGIQYAILPQTASVGNESRIKFESSDPPFGTTATVLVGETMHQAHAGKGEGSNISSHYPSAAFTGKSFVYFRAFTRDDLKDYGSDVKFWTIDGNGVYRLFNSYSTAYAFLPDA